MNATKSRFKIRSLFAWTAILIVFVAAMREYTVTSANLIIPALIESSTVHIHAGQSQGSGTIFTKNFGGKNEYFVLTAAHVIESLRTSDGDWMTAEITRQVRDRNGIHVGKSVYSAVVVEYDKDFDIAILYVVYVAGTTSAVMDGSGQPVAVGTSVYHCGSPYGIMLGYNSVTKGIIAQTGKVFPDNLSYYDQISCPALPGSSGGGIYNAETGEYIGMVVMGILKSDTFHYCVPARSILSWAALRNFSWLFTDKKTEESILEIITFDSVKVSDNEDDAQGDE